MALCVYCRRREEDPEWRPFCSERCKMADLGRWLGEEYRIPGEPAAPAEPSPESPAERPRRDEPPPDSHA